MREIKICIRLNWVTLSCSALPAAKKVFFHLTAKNQHRCRQRTNRCETSLTCYKCGKHVRKTRADTLALQVGAKVIFEEHGPLYIFVGETEDFCYFQEENCE